MAKKSFSAGVTKTGVLDNAGGAKIKEIQAKAQYNFQYRQAPLCRYTC